MKKRIPFRIEQTRNKHSRAVYKNDTIVIRLAKNLSAKQKQEHANDLLKRMSKQLIKELNRSEIAPFKPLLSKDGLQSSVEITLASGRKYLAAVSQGDTESIKHTANGFIVHITDKTNLKTTHRMLWKALAAMEHDHITSLVHLINHATYNVSISDVKLTFAKSQWGSCAPTGRIMLNTALLFVPEYIQEYVIVHELAHRIHPNHSVHFWNCVEEGFSNHKKARKELRQFKIGSL